MTEFKMRQVAAEETIGRQPHNGSWFTGPEFTDNVGLFDRVTSGADFNYGAAMAYLTRRFGPAQSDYDDYKELSCWRLTTQHPDVFLRISPNVANDIDISISILISTEMAQRIHDFERAADHAWKEDFAKHLTRLPVEPWFEQAKAYTPNTKSDEERLAWGVLFMGRSGGSSKPSPSEKAAQVLLEDYLKDNPYPDPLYRPTNPEAFSKEDPLLEVIAPAEAAMKDLMRGVGVRDWAINLFGPVESAEVPEAVSCGRGVGPDFESDPERYRKIQKLLALIDADDPDAGLDHAIAQYEPASPDDTPEPM